MTAETTASTMWPFSAVVPAPGPFPSPGSPTPGGPAAPLPGQREAFEELVRDAVVRLTDSPTLGRLAAAVVDPALEIAVVLVVAYVLSRVGNRLVDRALGRMQEPQEEVVLGRLRGGRLREGRTPPVTKRRVQRANALAGLARSLLNLLIWGTALLMVLGTLGINLAPLIASAGILGIAIGFGAQDLVKDFLSGAFMLVEDQYGVGDVIDVGDAVGVVESIGLRSTEVRSVDGTLWHVPHGVIARVGNKSQEFSRVLLDIAVSYEADVDQASETILDAAREVASEEPWDALVLEEPEIWGVEHLGESGVSIRLVIKITPGEQWPMARALRQRIKEYLDEAQIRIPFPQRTVWRGEEATSAPGEGGGDLS